MCGKVHHCSVIQPHTYSRCSVLSYHFLPHHLLARQRSLLKRSVHVWSICWYTTLQLTCISLATSILIVLSVSLNPDAHVWLFGTRYSPQLWVGFLCLSWNRRWVAPTARQMLKGHRHRENLAQGVTQPMHLANVALGTRTRTIKIWERGQAIKTHTGRKLLMDRFHRPLQGEVHETSDNSQTFTVIGFLGSATCLTAGARQKRFEFPTRRLRKSRSRV